MVSLDSEDIRTHLLDILPDYVTGEIADVMVTKVKFTGKILADESIKGTLKIYAKISFFDSHVAAKMTLERKLAGIPVQLLEPETGGEPE